MLYCLCVSIICLCVPKRIASFVCHRCMYLLLLLLLFVLPAGCTLYARSPIVFDAVGFRLKSGRLRSAEVSLAATGTPRPGSAVLGSGGQMAPRMHLEAHFELFLALVVRLPPSRTLQIRSSMTFSSGCWLPLLAGSI